MELLLPCGLICRCCTGSVGCSPPTSSGSAASRATAESPAIALVAAPSTPATMATSLPVRAARASSAIAAPGAGIDDGNVSAYEAFIGIGHYLGAPGRRGIGTVLADYGPTSSRRHGRARRNPPGPGPKMPGLDPTR
jgi:hypothetical protein